eukprot:TRINITY_DN44933_c0_g1_i1.p1 TRINITY_DN44933_c0_g1~~TRINITY_DN44933_c0_g1_i1.p1  ORF type:complete len:789 (+),score=182.47 TRINITY_DN44933_c0_g1_i1:63-2429(+)
MLPRLPLPVGSHIGGHHTAREKGADETQLVLPTITSARFLVQESESPQLVPVVVSARLPSKERSYQNKLTVKRGSVSARAPSNAAPEFAKRPELRIGRLDTDLKVAGQAGSRRPSMEVAKTTGRIPSRESGRGSKESVAKQGFVSEKEDYDEESKEKIAALKQRLELAEALSKQLELVSQAQKKEIAKLKAVSKAWPAGPQQSPAGFAVESNCDDIVFKKNKSEDRKKRKSKDAEDPEEAALVAEFRRLRSEAREVEAAKKRLVHVNRRYSSMVYQLQATEETLSDLESDGEADLMHCSALTRSPRRGCTSIGLRAPREAASPSSPASPSSTYSPRSGGRDPEKHEATHGAFVSHLCGALWREATPRGVLSWLLRSAGNFLEKGAAGQSSIEVPLTVTLYVSDTWLCKNMADEGDEKRVQVLRRKAIEVKVENQVAVTLHAFQREEGDVPAPRFDGRIPQKMLLLDDALIVPLGLNRKGSPLGAMQVLRTSAGKLDMTNLQAKTLTLMVGVAACVITLRRRYDATVGLRRRIKESMSLLIAAHGADTMVTFDHVVKQQLCSFFGVEEVRVLYRDMETRELLVMRDPEELKETDTKFKHFHYQVVGRRALERFLPTLGLVGRVNRKPGLLHIKNIAKAVEASERIDGIRLGTELAYGNMLLGPMTVIENNRSKFVGVVQLVGKSKPTTFDDTEDMFLDVLKESKPQLLRKFVPFTDQDSQFFEHISKVIGHASLLAASAQQQSLLAEAASSALVNQKARSLGAAGNEVEQSSGMQSTFAKMDIEVLLQR